MAYMMDTYCIVAMRRKDPMVKDNAGMSDIEASYPGRIEPSGNFLEVAFLVSPKSHKCAPFLER